MENTVYPKRWADFKGKVAFKTKSIYKEE